jgi:hypothetical protein
MPIRPVIPLVVTLLLLAGCDTRPKQQEPRRPISRLGEAEFLSVTPIADGGAYAASLNGGLWYLREGQGVRVKGMPSQNDLPLAVLPLAEGGAYVTGLAKGIWYVRGDTAVKVEEVSQLSSVTPSLLPKEKWLWALLQAEIARHNTADEGSASTKDE